MNVVSIEIIALCLVATAAIVFLTVLIWTKRPMRPPLDPKLDALLDLHPKLANIRGRLGESPSLREMVTWWYAAHFAEDRVAFLTELHLKKLEIMLRDTTPPPAVEQVGSVARIEDITSGHNAG